jgi:hypothetical protein
MVLLNKEMQKNYKRAKILYCILFFSFYVRIVLQSMIVGNVSHKVYIVFNIKNYISVGITICFIAAIKITVSIIVCLLFG